MARFKAKDIFFIRGRNLAVVAGKVVEGQFHVGDCVEIPQPTDIHLSNRIAGIEFITVKDDSGVVGLAFSFHTETERNAWKLLDLHDKELKTTSCS